MMMFEVPALVCRVLNPAEKSSALSVVSIQTTRPLYLVFGRSDQAPLAVVQFGSGGELLRLHKNLRELHALLPTLVPASLSCVQWQDDTYVHIQEGMCGIPWFNLRHRFRSCHGWNTLRDRALRALGEFQTAMGKRPDWIGTVNPGNELLQQLRFARASGIVWPDAVEGVIRRAADALQSLGRFQWPFQHGDFCFNNLMVSDDALSLIDFDEFGLTSMPLHDELSLAFSVYDFMADMRGAPSLAEQVRATVARTVSEHPELRPHLGAFVLHHLLWRINQCASRPTREPMKVALIQLVRRCTGENWG